MDVNLLAIHSTLSMRLGNSIPTCLFARLQATSSTRRPAESVSHGGDSNLPAVKYSRQPPGGHPGGSYRDYRGYRSDTISAILAAAIAAAAAFPWAPGRQDVHWPPSLNPAPLFGLPALARRSAASSPASQRPAEADYSAAAAVEMPGRGIR